MTYTGGRYPYTFIWSAEGEGYVGLCDEFPSLGWVAATEAFSGILRVAAECVEDKEESR